MTFDLCQAPKYKAHNASNPVMVDLISIVQRKSDTQNKSVFFPNFMSRKCIYNISHNTYNLFVFNTIQLVKIRTVKMN